MFGDGAAVEVETDHRDTLGENEASEGDSGFRCACGEEKTPREAFWGDECGASDGCEPAASKASD